VGERERHRDTGRDAVGEREGERHINTLKVRKRHRVTVGEREGERHRDTVREREGPGPPDSAPWPPRVGASSPGCESPACPLRSPEPPLEPPASHWPAAETRASA